MENLDPIIERIQSQQLQIGKLVREQKHEEALALAEASALEAEQAFGYRHEYTAATYSTLGGCLSRLHRDEEAKDILEKALDISRSQTGDDSLSTAQVRNNLSAVYRNLHRPRIALYNALETLRIRRGQMRANDPAIATSINNLGFTLSHLGDITAALACYRLATPFDTATRTAEHNYRVLIDKLAADPRFLKPENIPPADILQDFDLDGLQDLCNSWLQQEPREERFTLRFGRPSHLESYQHYVFQLKIMLAKADLPTGSEQSQDASLLREARHRLIRQVGLPVSSATLYLKRVNRQQLGPLSLATLECVFPNFNAAEAVAYDQRLKEAGIPLDQYKTFNDLKKENLERQGLKPDITYTDRQFRRYAGDNNLPRNCYSSVCFDAGGDDGQTLCRELYEYTDPRIPGFVFVGDTWDRELMAALNSLFPETFNPAAQGLFVLLLPPVEEALRPAYHKMYEPVLRQTGNWDGMSVIFIPTDIHSETIEQVVDLRQRETQQWFSRFFPKGDGAVFLKTARRPLSDFTDMLPALVYPEYGGSGVTKSIGTWLRLAGVNGLVYPAARSDVSVAFDSQGQPAAFYGWNFVDYRNALFVADHEMHVDLHDWYDFIPGRQEAPALFQRPDGWQIKGSEKRYHWDRSAFIELLNNLPDSKGG